MHFLFRLLLFTFFLMLSVSCSDDSTEPESQPQNDTTAESNDKAQSSEKDETDTSEENTEQAVEIDPETGLPVDADEIYYIPVQDAFHINLEGEHIMRIRVTVGTYDYDVAQSIRRTYYVPIRHQLHLLFSKVKYEHIRYAIAKDELAEKALKIVRDIVKVPEGKPGIDSVIFTEFTIQ